MPATTTQSAPAASYSYASGAELAQLLDRLALQASQGTAPAGIIELRQTRADGTRSTYRLQPTADSLAAFRGRAAPLIRAGLMDATPKPTRARPAAPRPRSIRPSAARPAGRVSPAAAWRLVQLIAADILSPQGASPADQHQRRADLLTAAEACGTGQVYIGTGKAALARVYLDCSTLDACGTTWTIGRRIEGGDWAILHTESGLCMDHAPGQTDRRRFGIREAAADWLHMLDADPADWAGIARAVQSARRLDQAAERDAWLTDQPTTASSAAPACRPAQPCPAPGPQAAQRAELGRRLRNTLCREGTHPGADRAAGLLTRGDPSALPELLATLQKAHARAAGRLGRLSAASSVMWTHWLREVQAIAAAAAALAAPRPAPSPAAAPRPAATPRASIHAPQPRRIARPAGARLRGLASAIACGYTPHRGASHRLQSGTM